MYNYVKNFYIHVYNVYNMNHKCYVRITKNK